jgi:putative transcriptional regulator
VYERLLRLAVTVSLAIAIPGILAGATTRAIAQDNERETRESIVLVAAPHLYDPNFNHSVVLVMFPPGRGPGGVILNRPTSMTLRDIWAEPEKRHGRTDALYIGGPVQPDGLLFLFRMTPPPVRAWRATENIYFSGEGELLKQLLEQTDSVHEQRFFAGYAGWAEGQLEMEVSRGDWLVLKADPEIIYDTDSATLWDRMYQRATLLRVDRAKLLRVHAPQPHPERIAYH